MGRKKAADKIASIQVSDNSAIAPIPKKRGRKPKSATLAKVQEAIPVSNTPSDGIDQVLDRWTKRQSTLNDRVVTDAEIVRALMTYLNIYQFKNSSLADIMDSILTNGHIADGTLSQEFLRYAVSKGWDDRVRLFVISELCDSLDKGESTTLENIVSQLSSAIDDGGIFTEKDEDEEKEEQQSNLPPWKGEDAEPVVPLKSKNYRVEKRGVGAPAYSALKTKPVKSAEDEAIYGYKGRYQDPGSKKPVIGTVVSASRKTITLEDDDGNLYEDLPRRYVQLSAPDEEPHESRPGVSAFEVELSHKSVEEIDRLLRRGRPVKGFESGVVVIPHQYAFQIDDLNMTIELVNTENGPFVDVSLIDPETGDCLVSFDPVIDSVLGSYPLDVTWKGKKRQYDITVVAS